jgi:hypothetical protein
MLTNAVFADRLSTQWTIGTSGTPNKHRII